MKVFPYKSKIVKHSRKLGILIAFAVLMVTKASAGNLTEELANYTTVSTSFLSWGRSVLALFMEPPLNIFVGIGVMGIILGKVRKLIRTR